MRNNICHFSSKQQTKTSLLVTCAALLLGIFSLCISFPVHASDPDAAVAIADATVDDTAVNDVIDHAINTQGLTEAKSISQSDGIVVLHHDSPAVQIAKKPEEKSLQKKPKLVETKPQTNAMQLFVVRETK